MSRQEQRQVQQTTEQQEIKYTVQQDFLNIIGIAQDVQETINFYQDDPNHQMVQVQMNRLVLQLNLSNGIHVDLNQRSNDRNSLSTQKKFVGTKLDNVMENCQYDERIKGYLSKYKKQNLCENPFLKQESGVEVQVKSNFDQSVVQKVIGGMRKVDDEMNEIAKGKKIQQLTDDEIKTYLEKRSQNAKSLLKKNMKENNKQDKIQNDNQKSDNNKEIKIDNKKSDDNKEPQVPVEKKSKSQVRSESECCMIQ